ncbi:MAG: hypothetical protein M0015_11710 [Betaproteobacteria bacterium]|nr:hypothetical protein [Betaproteobacteria bacterium]
MLRLWRDRVLIALAPDSIAVARFARWPRPRVVTALARDCDPRAGAEPWRGAAAALAEVVAGLKGSAAEASVVLSNHFVRYALVPDDANLSGGEEELAFARFCFAKIHGERSKSWEVRLAVAAPGSPRIASAVDAELIEAIRACFPANGTPRLASVQPYLMAAFNRWRRLACRGAVWLLLAEAKRACLARLERGRWTALRNVKGDFGSPASWRELIEREGCLLDAPGTQAGVLVHAPFAESAPAEASAWQYTALRDTLPRGRARLDHPLHALALCAR